MTQNGEMMVRTFEYTTITIFLVIETKTICDVGCILTSTSMALNYYHISIDGQSANPGTLNKWLKANNGYTSGNDFIENRLEKLSPLIKYRGQKEREPIIKLSKRHFVKIIDLNDSEIIDNLNNGIVTIAHVSISALHVNNSILCL